MRLAISATGPGLEQDVDPRFGRAPWFLFYDTADDSLDWVENLGCNAQQGAGISTAQFIVDHGAEVVLTGRCGPNAQSTLDSASVAVRTGVVGTVGEAVEAFRTGRLSAVQDPAAYARLARGGCGGRRQGGRGGRRSGRGRGGGRGLGAQGRGDLSQGRRPGPDSGRRSQRGA